jgi:hypothetical protein
VLALYADGAQLSSLEAGAAGPVFVNATNLYQLRAFYQGLVGDNVEFVSGTRFMDGASVTWQYTATLDEYRRFGIAPLMGEATMLVQDGKIQEARFELTSDSVLMLATARSHVSASAAASRPSPTALPVCTG